MAAVNPGNSGGPLLNLRGEVVGVNAAIVTESGGFEGISFAIPSNMALHVANQLIAHGTVKRGWLGASLQDLTPEVARGAGLATPKGALVADLAPGGPAAKAGLKRGDVVRSFAGQPVDDVQALRNEVAAATIGDAAKLSVWRAGHSVDVTVTVGDLADSVQALAAEARTRLGVTVRAVTSAERSRFGLDPDAGVAIAAVAPGGSLGHAGFEPGDLLLEVNGEALAGVEGFAERMGGLRRGDQITLLALDHRTGRTGYVQVTAD